MNEDMKETFTNLSDALDSDFESSTDLGETIDEKLEIIESAKTEIVEKVEEGDTTIEDKKYMEDTLKLMIESGKKVLTILEKDIKIGSQPRQAEVYFNGMGKVADTVRSLMDLNKSVVELKIKDTKAQNSGTKNLTVNQYYTSSDLLKMARQAEEESSLKEIKAEFYIDKDEQL